MNSVIPQYHERRLILTELDAGFREFIGGPDVIDIGQTIRVMLGDYFYGEPAEVYGQDVYTQEDRTLVFPMLAGCLLTQEQLDGAIEMLGDIFWTMSDMINTRVLMLSPEYTHRPSDCFYKFFPATFELVVYVPVMQGFNYAINLAPFDGRAVITACQDTLPSYFRIS